MAFTPPSMLPRPAGTLRVGDPATDAFLASIDANNAAIRANGEAKMRNQRRLENVGKIATVGAIGGPLVGGLFTGGGAAAAAAPAAGAVTGSAGTAATLAPAAGKLATIGKLFSSPGFTTAVNAGMGLVGMSSARKSADQARQDTLIQQREAIALERQRLENEARNADLDREDAKALNAAINALKQQELDLQIEARDYDRNIYSTEQARLQPYRQASTAALNRLMSMWGAQ